MRKVMTATALFGLLLAFTPAANAQCVASDDSSGTQCYTLFAGQTIDAGMVCVTVNGNDLDITYTTTNGWTLSETHLWVGSNIGDMPQTRKGNPIPGQFPYVSGNITGATSYTSSVSLSSIGFVCPGDDQNFLMAAHASVSRDNGDGTYQTETGWSDGGRITERGNWATLSTVTLTCDCGGGGGGGGGECETAFAYGDPLATCFLDIDEDADGDPDFMRWGWTNGPLSEGSYTFDIYAGAGQCSLTKGTLVGMLTVDYFGGSATVTYYMNGSYTMDETHLYIGNEILARDVNNFYTVAPGQYGNIHDLTSAGSDTFTVNGLSGEVYVVAHAVVCGF